jgi:hypothetical protein
MFVTRNGKAFESSLIKVATAAAMIMFVMPPHVRHADPAQPTSECLIGFRPRYQMPMIRHNAVGQQFDRITPQPFGQHPLEGRIILRLVKQSHPSVPTIKDVVDQPGFNGSCGSRHVVTFTRGQPIGKY